MTTACGECTSTVITVSENPNNVQMKTTFTVIITAVNLCGETSSTATASYTLSKLQQLLLNTSTLVSVLMCLSLKTRHIRWQKGAWYRFCMHAPTKLVRKRYDTGKCQMIL